MIASECEPDWLQIDWMQPWLTDLRLPAGALIGQPEIQSYWLVSYNGEDLTRNDGFEAAPSLNATLQTDDVTELTIDWAEPYGELSSGEYEVVLWIKDIYDESQKHPLMRNFYDTQIYAVRFTVS